MTSTRRILRLAVLLAATGSLPAADPSVSEWTETLTSPAATAEESHQARAALRAIAGGSTEAPDTREAAIALAEFWLGREDETLDREAREALGTATALYPDDPRTPRLLRGFARRQVSSGDPYGAHISFRQLLDRGWTGDDPELIATAAYNAAQARDMASALEWSSAVDPAQLDGEARSQADLARVMSGQALGRHEIALESARSLVERDRERLYTNDAALLAAARVYESFGLLDEAMRLLEAFVNIHPRADEHAEALIELAGLQQRTGNRKRAERTLRWVVDAHPDSPAALRVRLELLEIDGRPAESEQAEEYVDATREANTTEGAREVCRRFAERFIAGGLPLEAFDALAGLAAERGESIAPLAARHCLSEIVAPTVALLASRNDDAGIALIATVAGGLDLDIPQPQQEEIVAARLRLGLLPAPSGALDRALTSARASMRDENWPIAIETLEQGLMILGEWPHPRSVLRARRWIAEALWRDERSEQALATARDALAAATEAGDRRALRVLLGDILFSSGDRESACGEYREAAALASSRWIEMQLERCRGEAADAERGES